MKVLHLVDGYPPAGGCAGRWCQGLSRALAARGMAVQVHRTADPPQTVVQPVTQSPQTRAL